MAESQQKLVRGIQVPFPDPSSSVTGTSQENKVQIALKLIYEFWGFCINTPTSVFEPAGMTGKDFPSGFESGSNLIDTGTDGVTQFETPGLFFANSISWNQDHVGKFVVFWKPGEESPDDSIYRILRVENTDTVQIDRYGGGGTVRLGNKPSFSDRGNLYFRIVDIDAIGTSVTWPSSDQGMVLTFSGASGINIGQSNSQVRLYMDSDASQQIRLQVSPSGSWNGSDFTDGSSIISPDTDWGDISGTSFFYLAGSKDHIILHQHVDNTISQSEFGSGLHVEIPQRLYPESADPNPIAFMTYGQTNMSWRKTASNPQTNTYSDAMYFVSHDGTTEIYVPTHRIPHSPTLEFKSNEPIWKGTANEFQPIDSSTDAGRYHLFEQNLINQLSLSSDVTYYLNDLVRFSLSRVRMRKVRACHGNSPRGTRHGREWIHMNEGVMYPWDNCIIPYGPFWVGSRADLI